MNILDLIAADVSLRKQGKDYVGLCPFHHEQTPSFTVSPDRNLWYCFGCLRGGDAISWLRQHRSLSYQDAARLVGKEHAFDPLWARRRTLTARLTGAYWRWRRATWRALLAEDKELQTDIALYETFYRATVRAPASWVEEDTDHVTLTLADLYARREVIGQDLDLLQSTRDEQAVQTWWRAQRTLK